MPRSTEEILLSSLIGRINTDINFASGIINSADKALKAGDKELFQTLKEGFTTYLKWIQEGFNTAKTHQIKIPEETTQRFVELQNKVALLKQKPSLGSTETFKRLPQG
ncbi:MAG: hypothetical protein ACK5T0_05280 [Vampirovibrionales bacterium]